VGPLTGVACQRQHWSSHKRQCRDLAHAEFLSTFHHRTRDDLERILRHPEPSELPLLPKLSAITWTTLPYLPEMHFLSLISRGLLMIDGRPAPGDTKEGLIRLLKRATTELAWPELPGGTHQMITHRLRALTIVSDLGEPEAAIEIFSRHVEDVERKVVAPNHVAMCSIYRLDWLLAGAWKFEGDEDKRGAYVAEAKGLMERATRTVRALQPQDFDGDVRASTSPYMTLDRLNALVT
jgi:hypothetical protein